MDPPVALPSPDQVKEEAKKKGEPVPVLNDAELKDLKE